MWENDHLREKKVLNNFSLCVQNNALLSVRRVTAVSAYIAGSNGERQNAVWRGWKGPSLAVSSSTNLPNLILECTWLLSTLALSPTQPVGSVLHNNVPEGKPGSGGESTNRHLFQWEQAFHEMLPLYFCKYLFRHSYASNERRRSNYSF